MNDAFGIQSTLTDIFQNLAQFFVELVPRMVTGIVVFVLGVLVAKIVERILRTTFVRLRVDRLLERVGISKMVAGFGIKGSLSESTAKLVYYLLVILFLRGAANSVGLTVVSEAIGSFFSYLPNIVAALLVVLLGSVVARFAGNAVQQSASDSGVEYAPALGRAVSSGVLFVVSIMAISQLGIDTEMIRAVVMISMAGAAVGLALSFGLGSRDVTRNILAGFYARRVFRVGDELEFQGNRGVLSAITATQTLLEADGKTIAVANGVFLDEVVKS